MNGNPLQNEAGASDDRLELNPNTEAIADMKDGETRRVSMEITQVAAGSYTVANVQTVGETEETPEPGTEQQPEAPPNQGAMMPETEYPNPAVRKMMMR